MMTSNEYKTPSQRLEERSKSSNSNVMGWVLYLSMFFIIFGPLTYWVLKDDDYFKKGDTPIETPLKKPIVTIFSSEICNDGIDNDGDGKVDCHDTNCMNFRFCKPKPKLKFKVGSPCLTGKAKPCSAGKWGYFLVENKQACVPENPKCIPKEICTNGLDDDFDGQADCSDADCVHIPACNPHEDCTDGFDNDGDGDIDCRDADCATHIVCNSVEICTDGFDNDEDGFVDCNDSDCLKHDACKPKAKSGMTGAQLPKPPKPKLK